jgi:segregation and condensation protein B
VTENNIDENQNENKEEAQPETQASVSESLSLRAMVEGVLFATGHPLSVKQLSELIGEDEEKITNILGELQEAYAHEDRGFWLVRVAGGYQLRTKPRLKELMSRFYEKKPPRLTQPMLEVLSIVGYKQPVTRPLIDKIRGVDSTAPLKALLDRGLLEMRGRSESVGNPVLYATTQKFLEWFQIASLQDLPPLSEIELLRQASPILEGDELLAQLERDDGFVSEDLRELDTTLLDVARQQRKFETQISDGDENTEAVAADVAVQASEPTELQAQ